jgi:hypothetical protein
LIFDWSFDKEERIDCRITTVSEKSLRGEDIFQGIFQVNNKVNLKGDLIVTGGIQGELAENDWVKGGEELTFSGLTVVYNGTEDKFPPIAEYSLGIKDNSGLTPIDNPNAGEPLSETISAPENTIDNNYRVKIVGLPEGSDVSAQSIDLKIDNDPPDMPENVICKADTFDELEPAAADNDPEVYIGWDEVTDLGSGTSRYYYNFENNGGTDEGSWTNENQAKLSNASEGVNNVYVWAEDAVGNIGEASSSTIFVDLTEITFDNFEPAGYEWLTSETVNCTIDVNDLNGFGIDIDRIEYWDIQTKFWRPVTAIDFTSNLTSINVLSEAQLNEGTESFIRFRAWDLVGNGPTESERYNFKIDVTPVTYTEVIPEPSTKQSVPTVKCYMTVEDLGGSGVNLSTIQYSYSTNGLENFTAWSDSNLATIAKKDNPEESSRWFVDITFERGAENYIRWRAMDLAGNGYTVSENYSVLINALPTIIVKEINAGDTYDIDNHKRSLEFFWRSNISGNLGFDPNMTIQLSAGPHRITLEVSDGLNSAYYETNITVAPYKKPKSGGGIASISEGMDSLVLALIIIIIIIIVIFLIAITRERRKRRYLEEKVISSGFQLPSRYQPMVPTSKLMPQLKAEGSMAGSEPFPVSTSPYTVVGGKGSIEQLPRVGETAASPRPTVADYTTGTTPTTTSGPIVSTPGQQLPQLPPAQKPIAPQPTSQQPPGKNGQPLPSQYKIKIPIPTVAEPGQTKPQPSPTPTIAPTPTLKQEEPEPEPTLGLTPDDPEYLKRIRKEKD